MRSKVARSSGGHAFEDRFLNLSELQLVILYNDISREEEKEKTEKMELVKMMNELWSNKFNGLFEVLRFFVNPQMYKAVKEMEEIKHLEKEVSVENFSEEWEKMMEMIPTEYIVDDRPVDLESVSEHDPEFEELLTGWLEVSKKYNKE